MRACLDLSGALSSPSCPCATPVIKLRQRLCLSVARLCSRTDMWLAVPRCNAQALQCSVSLLMHLLISGAKPI